MQALLHLVKRSLFAGSLSCLLRAWYRQLTFHASACSNHFSLSLLGIVLHWWLLFDGFPLDLVSSLTPTSTSTSDSIVALALAQ
ncbi:hypothetical protein BCR37DRAFT_380652 [Protomyces lactucae-debilis]|uniref:Uncharacterized protein n=1 Tax=Protomyces lactucae-debilis TaxID=2754530 RepID=A0A1Y2FA97_PROLT|nr:uncharacterized protein BCR37DRAFT_380652 [Protomyces lactucae-debilis]ORY80840.1 hypothetical protein BCR37DRAFT_380652 [Protomyces lactucae-debilis]